MKNLILKRVWSDETGTYGVISDEHPFAVTLEPADCIPQGEYKCVRYQSPRFKDVVFLLENVPGHTYIEIHKGNTIVDTSGCILVGRQFGTVGETYGIQQSASAYFEFMNVRLKEEQEFMLEII